jgi:hypothetical protein
MLVEDRLQRPQHPHRRQPLPTGRAIGDRRAYFLAPAGRWMPRRRRGKGVGLEDLASGRERLAEPEREVERLADEQHAVGLCEDLRKRAEAGVGDTSRALHRDDRDAELVLEAGWVQAGRRG